VTLELDVVIFAKDIEPPLQLLFRFLIFTLQQQLRDDGTDAARSYDQPFVMLQDQLLIDSRIFAVEPLNETQ
jgi:hypothetical protein